MSGFRNLSQNLGVVLKLYVPEILHEANSILKTQNVMCYSTKFSRPRLLH